MKIRTKEQYNKTHKPCKPKSRQIKREKILITETVRNPLKKLIPFIPNKDKELKPLNTRNLKKNIHPIDLLNMWIPTFSHTRTFTLPNIKSKIKNAANVRVIKKRQRRRSYLRMCRS